MPPAYDPKADAARAGPLRRRAFRPRSALGTPDDIPAWVAEPGDDLRAIGLDRLDDLASLGDERIDGRSDVVHHDVDGAGPDSRMPASGDPCPAHLAGRVVQRDPTVARVMFHPNTFV